MSPGLSNSYLLRADDGRIIVNTGMGFEGPRHRTAFDAVDAAPTRAVVFTQGHYDHVGGVDCLREEGTEVIAQANFGTWRDDNERLEAFRVRNAAFAWMRRHRGGPFPRQRMRPGASAPRPVRSRPGRSPTGWTSGSGAASWCSCPRREARRPTPWSSGSPTPRRC